VHRARVPRFSVTVLWVRVVRDIPMADDSFKEFDGYIMSDGEFASLDDSDRVLARMSKLWSDKKKIFNQLGRFVLECSNKGKDVSAHAYAEKMLLYAETAGEKAFCLLCMGQLKERVRDYGEALKTYLSAMDLAPERNDIWYFLNNNLGERQGQAIVIKYLCSHFCPI